MNRLKIRWCKEVLESKGKVWFESS
jgi:hypothetical protein